MSDLKAVVRIILGGASIRAGIILGSLTVSLLFAVVRATTNWHLNLILEIAVLAWVMLMAIGFASSGYYILANHSSPKKLNELIDDWRRGRKL